MVGPFAHRGERDKLVFHFLEDKLVFLCMEDKLVFPKVEDKVNFCACSRPTIYLVFPKVEDKLGALPPMREGSDHSRYTYGFHWLPN